MHTGVGAQLRAVRLVRHADVAILLDKRALQAGMTRVDCVDIHVAVGGRHQQAQC